MSDTALPAPRAILGPQSASALARLIALSVPVALLGGALVSQYVGHLWPCEMCWWQRYPHAAAIVLAGAAFLFPSATPRARALVTLGALAIAVSGAIGVYHAGVEAHLFKGFTSCSTLSSGGTTADVFNEIMKVPLIQCDQIQWRFLGLSLAAWNAVISLPAAFAVWVLIARGRLR